jgi:hypothetical protein
MENTFNRASEGHEEKLKKQKRGFIKLLFSAQQ